MYVHMHVCVCIYVRMYKFMCALTYNYVATKPMLSICMLQYFEYIGKKVKQVDKRLLQIRLSNFITRHPCSINQQKFWKGTQLIHLSL